MSVDADGFALKNHRRFSARNTADTLPAGMAVVDRLADTLSRRLTESDFLVRLDRHTLMLVLPGRTRDHAVTLASAARNEVAGHLP
jgi:GGDEF domain-containing protein